MLNLRKHAVAARLALVALVMAACAPPAGDRPPPATVLLSPSPLAARWLALKPEPAAAGLIWSPDRPLVAEPRAFGSLALERGPGPVLTIGRIRLATELPAERTQATVFVAGSYGEEWREVVSRTVRDSHAWNATPLYSLVSTTVGKSLGTVSPSAGPEPVTALLRANGLIDAQAAPRRIFTRGPVIRYAYFRVIEGLTVYTNKAIAGIVTSGGDVWAIGRRRPLLVASAYPLRSPSSAWQLVQQGRWITIFVDDDTSPDSARIDEFVVTAVELAYAETEVNASHELMQPYYVFRDSAGHALYVPAIADPLVQLPDRR